MPMVRNLKTSASMQCGRARRRCREGWAFAGAEGLMQRQVRARGAGSGRQGAGRERWRLQYPLDDIPEGTAFNVDRARCQRRAR